MGDVAKLMVANPCWRESLGKRDINYIAFFNEGGGPFRGFSDDDGYRPDDFHWWPDLSDRMTIGIVRRMCDELLAKEPHAPYSVVANYIVSNVPQESTAKVVVRSMKDSLVRFIAEEKNLGESLGVLWLMLQEEVARLKRVAAVLAAPVPRFKPIPCSDDSVHLSRLLKIPAIPTDDISSERLPRWTLVENDKSGYCCVCHMATFYKIDCPIDEHTLRCESMVSQSPCCSGCFNEMSRMVAELIQGRGSDGEF